MERKILSKPVSRAAAILGGQAPLARELTRITGRPVKQGQVWNWIYRHGKPTPSMCIPIEEATHGVVTRYDLLPDVFGAAPEKAA